MRSRPILMSALMVRALFDGRKTQTRRPVRNVNAQDHPFVGTFDVRGGLPLVVFSDAPNDQVISRIEAKCPYGQPGDLLWVRETTAFWWSGGKATSVLGYRADVNDPHGDGFGCDDPWWLSCDWTPSIHTYRWASRLTLELTEMRVERLQDISEADAIAEGTEAVLVPPDGGSAPYVEGYRMIWESINGPASWEANPWVWCLSFRVHKQNVEDALKRIAR